MENILTTIMTTIQTATAGTPAPPPPPPPPPVWIQRLQNLRLLPPPCNELVPLLSTIAAFAVALYGFDLRSWWPSRLTQFSQEWSSLSLDPATLLFVWGTFAINMTVYWSYSTLIHVAEHIWPQTLVHFKIQPTEPIASWKDVMRMAPLVLFNQCVLGICMLQLFHQLLRIRHSWVATNSMDNNHDNDDIMSVPSLATFVVSMLVHIVCVEVWFYASHRFLHGTPWIYKHVHSLHHSYKAPSCLESVYVHPVEFVVQSFAVFLVGPLVTGAPLIVLWVWMGLVTFLQVHDHTGYWFPFLPRVLMHDYHHQAFNCCYGVLGSKDAIFQTDKGFATFVEKHEQSNPCHQKAKKRYE